MLGSELPVARSSVTSREIVREDVMHRQRWTIPVPFLYARLARLDRVGGGRACSSEPIAGGLGNPPRVPIRLDRLALAPPPVVGVNGAVELRDLRYFLACVDEAAGSRGPAREARNYFRHAGYE